jgi:outer membrane protein OmpA-like peptidoglycan-associated protein
VMRVKRYLAYTLAVYLGCHPTPPAIAKDNASLQTPGAVPVAADVFLCTGHLDEPMTEAFYTHCLAPTERHPDLQAANDVAQAPPSTCLTTPAHSRPVTCDLQPATLPVQTTPRDESTMQFITLDPVPFEFDKAELTDGAQRALDANTAYLLRQPGVTRILIYGHADDVGSGDYNYTLSEERSKAVADYLIGHGVPADLLYDAPRGERMPVDEYWTPEGRKRNRRVEIYAVVR